MSPPSNYSVLRPSRHTQPSTLRLLSLVAFGDVDLSYLEGPSLHRRLSSNREIPVSSKSVPDFSEFPYTTRKSGHIPASHHSSHPFVPILRCCQYIYIIFLYRKLLNYRCTILGESKNFALFLISSPMRENYSLTHFIPGLQIRYGFIPSNFSIKLLLPPTFNFVV